MKALAEGTRVRVYIPPPLLRRLPSELSVALTRNTFDYLFLHKTGEWLYVVDATWWQAVAAEFEAVDAQLQPALVDGQGVQS